jgi:hypothetical protein
MARKYTPSKRLAEIIERSKGTARPVDIFDLSRDDSERVREIRADLATTLGTTREDAVLRKAFKAFDLDPQDPRHWRRLLVGLAAVFFDNQRGGKPKWDERLWGQYKTDVVEVGKILDKNGFYPSDEAVAYYLCRRRPYSERWKHFGETALRRYMTKGNPPKAIAALRKATVNRKGGSN